MNTSLSILKISENFCEIVTHATQFQNEILQNFKLYFHSPEATIYYMISWILFCILNSKYLYLIKYKFKSLIHLKGSNRDRFYLKGGNLKFYLSQLIDFQQNIPELWDVKIRDYSRVDGGWMVLWNWQGQSKRKEWRILSVVTNHLPWPFKLS